MLTRGWSENELWWLKSCRIREKEKLRKARKFSRAYLSIYLSICFQLLIISSFQFEQKVNGKVFVFESVDLNDWLTLFRYSCNYVKFIGTTVIIYNHNLFSYFHTNHIFQNSSLFLFFVTMRVSLPRLRDDLPKYTDLFKLQMYDRINSYKFFSYNPYTKDTDELMCYLILSSFSS